MEMDMEYEYLDVGRTETVQTSQFDENSVEKYIEEEEVVGIPTSTTYSNKLIELGLSIQSEIQKKKVELQNHEGELKKEPLDSNTWDRLADSAPCLRRLLTNGNVTVSKIEEPSQKNSRPRPKSNVTITKFFTGESACSQFGNDSIANVNKYGRTSFNSSQSDVSSPLSNLDWSNYPAAQKLLQLAKLVQPKGTHFGTDLSRSRIFKNARTPAAAPENVVPTLQVPAKLEEVQIRRRPPAPVFHVPFLSAGLLPTLNTDSSIYKQKKSKDILIVTPIKCSTRSPFDAAPAVVPTQVKPPEVKRKRAKVSKSKPSASRDVSPTKKARTDDDEQVDPNSFLEVSLEEEEESTPPSPVYVDERQRSHQCNFCPKSFFWITDLKRHVLTHTGERPFKCPYCTMDYTRKFLMEKHVRKSHTEVDYEHFIMNPRIIDGRRRSKLRPVVAVKSPSIPTEKVHGSAKDNFLIQPPNMKLTSPMTSPGVKHCNDGHRPFQCRFIPTDWYKSPEFQKIFEVNEKNEELDEEEKQRQRLEEKEKFPILAKQLGANNHAVVEQ